MLLENPKMATVLKPRDSFFKGGQLLLFDTFQLLICCLKHYRNFKHFRPVLQQNAQENWFFIVANAVSNSSDAREPPCTTPQNK